MVTSTNVKLRILWRFVPTWASPNHHLTFTWHSPDIHLTFTWRSPYHHLTIIWPFPDRYLTLIRSLWLKESCLVGGGGGLTHYKPYLRVISQVWRLTWEMTLSLTICRSALSIHYMSLCFRFTGPVLRSRLTMFDTNSTDHTSSTR